MQLWISFAEPSREYRYENWAKKGWGGGGGGLGLTALSENCSSYSDRFRNTQPLKRQTIIAADDILIFYFYFSKKIMLDFSCESSDDSLETTPSLIFSE